MHLSATLHEEHAERVADWREDDMLKHLDRMTEATETLSHLIGDTVANDYDELDDVIAAASKDGGEGYSLYFEYAPNVAALLRDLRHARAHWGRLLRETSR